MIKIEKKNLGLPHFQLQRFSTNNISLVKYLDTAIKEYSSEKITFLITTDQLRRYSTKKHNFPFFSKKITLPCHWNKMIIY